MDYNGFSKRIIYKNEKIYKLRKKTKQDGKGGEIGNKWNLFN